MFSKPSKDQFQFGSHIINRTKGYVFEIHYNEEDVASTIGSYWNAVKAYLYADNDKDCESILKEFVRVHGIRLKIGHGLEERRRTVKTLDENGKIVSEERRAYFVRIKYRYLYLETRLWRLKQFARAGLLDIDEVMFYPEEERYFSYYG